MDRLYIDIETIPSQRDDIRDYLAQKVSPPAAMKKAETIEKWEREQKAAAIAETVNKTGLDSTYGEIVCIGYAFNDDPIECLYRAPDGSERDLLQQFDAALSEYRNRTPGKPASLQWIGHYVTGFDLRFIRNRMVVNGYKPDVRIPCDAKPWSDEVFDTCIAWGGVSKGGTTSKLDAVCLALGIPMKGDIDGSKVWEAIQAGRLMDVVQYCKDDVNRVRELHKRLT